MRGSRRVVPKYPRPRSICLPQLVLMNPATALRSPPFVPRPPTKLEEDRPRPPDKRLSTTQVQAAGPFLLQSLTFVQLSDHAAASDRSVPKSVAIMLTVDSEDSKYDMDNTRDLSSHGS